MIKYLCDICKSEIADMNFHGEFMMNEKAFVFIKHQKEDQVRVMKFLFCPDCAEKIKLKALELQKNERDGK